LNKAALLDDLEAIGFFNVGYGCTTCLVEGTPVLQAHGTARPIQAMPSAGGGVVMSPSVEGRAHIASHRETMEQGVRDCVRLTLQDGRELVCTPDHEFLTVDGRWVRADALELDADRLVVGLDAPLDERDRREEIFELNMGDFTLDMKTPQARVETLAFARLLGRLLGDGSLSTTDQARVHVGQAVDRELVLHDVEVLTGKRAAANAHDERQGAVVLPEELSRAIRELPGALIGRLDDQQPQLPEFVLDDLCPVSVVREYLGGAFGAHGHAPYLRRREDAKHDSSFVQPAYSQTARPEHVEALEEVMTRLTWLLGRCGVRMSGHTIHKRPARASESSWTPADGAQRIEVRLQLPDGLSFVEKVGYRYCVDKALRASAAAAYWRMLSRRHLQTEDAQTPRPVDLESRDLPSPLEFLQQAGAREWFPVLEHHEGADDSKSSCVEEGSLELPTFGLGILERREAGAHRVFDIAVDEHEAFFANGVAVHNCIGNSGPLPGPIEDAVVREGLVVASVLSGNRNFEGRVSPHTRGNYLASPPLVVAFALAGTVDIDPYNDPLTQTPDGKDVFLKDIWPSDDEIREVMGKSVTREQFMEQYASVFEGPPEWKALAPPTGEVYQWSEESTYIQEPPFFVGMSKETPPIGAIAGARCLVKVGESITTDHISPAGVIPLDSPASRYLQANGVEPKDFNSFGSRRGNDRVMTRGTFANVRLRNQLAPGTEGGYTTYFGPSEDAPKPDWLTYDSDVKVGPGEVGFIFDASVQYQKHGIPLVVLAGKDYGMGSSRDWAAKGTFLLGVRAVIAKSYERIHRSNLVGMGVLPLQFKAREGADELGLDGTETFDIHVDDHLSAGDDVRVVATRADGTTLEFTTTCRIDTPVEVDYYRNGGILHTVLRRMVHEG
ncbi:MAG: aconitase family protein, partial [Myxococcota bacterium]